MKKRYTCQVEKLIKDLTYIYSNNYPNNIEYFFSIIENIMDNIELYEKNTQLLFAKSLVELGEYFSENSKNLKNNKNKNKKDIDLHEEEMTKILNHFFTCILKLEKTVSDEHCKYLNQLIDSLVNNNYRIEFKKELINFANNLGKFGQSYTNRRYSVYFCTVLIRIGSNTQNELYKRLLFLCEDTDRVVKFEIIYQIRYLIKECSSQYCKDNILQHINIYLDEIELALKSTTVESLLVFDNLDKFIIIKNFKENLIEKIDQIIISDDYLTLQNDFYVFESIFNNLLNITLKNEKYRNIFIHLLKKYLKIFFLKKKIKDVENININENNNDENIEDESYSEENEIKLKLKTDYIIERFHEILNVFNEEKDIDFINELMKEGTKVFFQNENKDIFYKKYHLMINKLPLNSYNLSKNFLDKIFFFLKDDIDSTTIKNYYFFNSKNKNNSNINNFPKINPSMEACSPLLSSNKKSSYSNNNIYPYKNLYNMNNQKIDDDEEINKNSSNNSSNNNPIFKEYYLNEINNIFKEMLNIKNDEFIIFILCKFDSYYKTMIHLNDWRLTIEMIKALENLPKYFLYNHNKYKNFSEISIKLFGYCKNLLKNNLNITIEQEITNLLSELIQYDGVCRNEVVEYMRKNFLENKSFFRRRVYLLYSNSIFEKFSFKFIRDKQIYNDLYEKMLKNDNTLVQSWIIKLFNNYSVYEREVISLVKDIQEAQKKSENLDLLLNVEIKKYLVNANKNKKNIFNEYKNKNRFKGREFVKMDNEEEINKIEQDILNKKKKEDSESNNNNNVIHLNENKTKNTNKIKHLINGISISLNDNKKNSLKIYGNNKTKKDINIMGNFISNNNNNNNIYNYSNNNVNTSNNIPFRVTQRKSSMNYVRKNNLTKEFNVNNIKSSYNANKNTKKYYSKEKRNKYEHKV